MKNKKNESKYRSALFWGIIGILMLCGSGCMTYMTPVKPPMGLLFCNYKAPLTTDFRNNPTSSKIIKASKSKTYYFHEILLTKMPIAWGDAEISEIARKANIKEISYAEYELLNVLGIYAEFTINLYGIGGETR